MSYVVLARKWRPTQFDDVVGQGHVAQTLKNAIEQDRVHHAFLFTGARGVGKTSTARILAKALNCENGPTPTPCDACSSCKEITAGQAVDVFEIDGASNRGINEIRELRESVRYAPSRDRYKIYIIDEVHMLTTEAFNALLKTLEEPPPHAKFIFATTEPQKIPVTILSRCQRYDFKRIGQSDIVEHLQKLCDAEGIQTEREALQVIARQAAGGMRDALSILDQIISFAGNHVTNQDVNAILGVANRKHLFELSDAVITHDVERALLVLDEVDRYGYDLQQFASELVSHFRDLMVVSVVKEPEKVTQLTDSEIDAARVQTGKTDHSLLHRLFDVMASGAAEMGRSAFPKLIFEMTLVRLARLEPLIGLDLIADRLVELEKEFEGDPPSAEVRATPSTAPREMRRPLVDDSAVPTEPTGTPSRTAPSSALPEAAPAQADPRVDDAPSADEAVTPSTSDEAAPAEPMAEVPTQRHESEGHAAARSAELDDDADAPLTSLEETSSVVELLEPEITPPEIDSVVPDPEPNGEAVREVPAFGTPEPTLPRDSEAYDGENDHEEGASEPIFERLSPDEITVLGPTDRWKVVVEGLRKISKPLAAKCEHAYIEKFSDGEVELSFADKYLRFLEEGDHLGDIHDTLHALFGDSWAISIQPREDETGADHKTIAEEREDLIVEKRKQLERDLLAHPVVKEAQELFNVAPDSMRVQVKLFDDP